MAKNTIVAANKDLGNNGKMGGIFRGDRHSAPSGGIAVAVEGGGNVLVEDSEPIIVPEAVNSNTLVSFDGKKMKPKEVISLINQNYGGVPIKKKGGVIDAKAEIKRLRDIKEKKEKGGLLAPNGKKSNLTPEQYKLVRTKEFKKWFGDWENEPKNSSKVIDENGEPLFCLHYSDFKFNSFDISKQKDGYLGKGFYFSDKIFAVSLYGEFKYECFLNIRNPFYVDDKIINKYSAKIQIIDRFSCSRSEIKETLIKNNYDGIFSENTYLCFMPNQIKLADGKNTTFDINSNDIRYESGGNISTNDQPIKVKAGSVVITRNAALDEKTKHEYNGEMLTNKEILSRINHDIGGGVEFAEGGKIESNTFDKVISSSSRFKPSETIYFEPPLVGKNGAKLISYTWSYEWTMKPNYEGELVSKRISDWTQAEISADTGRDIVHKYGVELADGTFKSVSSESVPILLGYIDRNELKHFPNLVTASKTLAKQQMQLAILEAQEKEYKELQNKFEKAEKPKIEEIEEPIAFVKERWENGEHKVFSMGDAWIRQDNKHDYNTKSFLPIKEISSYSKEMLISDWVQKRIKENGGKYPQGVYDLRNRVERQKRKVNEILKSQVQEFENGGSLDCGCNHTMEQGGEILLAPNGNLSNLTPEQYKLIRTPQFKAWFGDWEKLAYAKINDSGIDEVTLENLSKDVSKVVDENGEPLVVYHFTDKRFTVFEKKGLSNGFFFTEYKKDEEFSYTNNPKPYFLSITKMSEVSEVPYRYWSTPNYENEFIDKSKKYGGNGIQFIREIDNKRIIVAFEPNQIKLADGTNTTFDINNPDIRFEKGGEINHEETYKKWKSLVNMSKGELENFYNSEEGKEAGLSSEKANELGIHSGRESARWIMKMKDTPHKDWTPKMWEWAKRQISFISRMSGNKGGLYDDKGNKTRKHTSLLIWGHNPEKFESGGNLIKRADGTYSKHGLWDSIRENAGSGRKPTKEMLEQEEKIKANSMAKGGLIAPNGNPSNLTPEQYNLVRTTAFKQWFGDWENDPSNASKVLDENGEPLICFHGTPDGRFNIYDETKFGSRTKNENSIAFFFTPSIWYAEAYSEKHNNEAIKIYEDMFGEKPRAVEPRPYAEEKMCFLNIRNPYYATSQTKEDLTYAKKNNFDGLILKYKGKNEIFEVAAFYSNQIKLADVTNTTFDATNNDIRFEKGGKLKKEDLMLCENCGWTWKVADSTPIDKYICYACGHNNYKKSN
jgi:hypothetical protein